MVDIRKPRRGSLAFRPRKRYKKAVPSINYWPEIEEPVPLGFAGYKVGMTTISYISNEPLTKGMEISTGATIVETPPMVVYGIRGYKQGKSYDSFVDDKKILERLKIKKAKSSFKEGESYEEIRLLLYTLPGLTGIGKKRPERMEIAIGGKSIEEKIKNAFSLLGKELTISDVFREGLFVDVVSITKGKGWQGPIKRFGVAKQRRKATGKIRHVGTLGPFHPAYVMYTVPMAGQTGYHKRTELNKLIVKIGKKEEAETINPKSGFPHYGIVKNDFVILKGSIPGVAKRLIRFRRAIRKPNAENKVKLTYISNEPKN